VAQLHQDEGNVREMIRIGVDVGGTFTDVVALDEDGTRRFVHKIPTTIDDQSIAVVEGIDHILAENGIDVSEVVFVGHGTTAGTNAFLTRRGARTVLLTTAGFEDVLEFRRMDRSGVLDPYDLQLDLPVPLASGRHRVGVRERIGPNGEVVVALTDAEIDRVVSCLGELEPEAVAISLLWGFSNPEHEVRLADGVRRAFPSVFVSVAHEVDPMIMEYERTSSTVINSYLGPLMANYLENLGQKLHERGLPTPGLVQSNGGMISIDNAARRPILLLESGPAAGVTACTSLVAEDASAGVLAIDMGGTSFETALLLDGKPQEVAGIDLQGYAVRAPFLDIRSIGAGGGSIAWVDEGGALCVGPQSAGATPGPACYGLGGDDPTVSDANVVLGYLDVLAGSTLNLDVSKARGAIETKIGSQLDLSATEGASAIYQLVNAHMADAMRLIAVERGVLPSSLSLVAYGGAGPTHAASLARELEIGRIIIPAHPGAISALGAATGDLVYEFGAPMLQTLASIDQSELTSRFEELELLGRKSLAAEGCRDDQVELEYLFVARYIGQLHDIPVTISLPARPDEMAHHFHERYKTLYGFSVEDEAIFLSKLRVRAVGLVAKPKLSGGARLPWPPSPRADRSVWFPEIEYTPCPVYQREQWEVGEPLNGPAIVQEYDSTTTVLPGQQWSVDEAGSVIIEEV
jgi:N-methylhydantoinase A